MTQPDNINTIMGLLGSPDEEARSRGLDCVAMEGGGTAVGHLLEAMKDSSLRRSSVVNRSAPSRCACHPDSTRTSPARAPTILHR